jgi:hypothetical protein
MLAALLVAGCTAGTGGGPVPAAPATLVPAATAATAAPPATPGRATPPPSATPQAATVFTADDEQIARLIRAGADEAIPQLKLLNDMDPSQLEDQFLPLGVWVASQKAGLEAYTPSGCTAAATDLFIDGIDAYDTIRKQFLAWRDWGANGHAFPVAAPGQAVLRFEESLAELEAHCPA